MAFEIERKFLIEKPSDTDIQSLIQKVAVEIRNITQTYLVSKVGERRVRKVTNQIGTTTYFYTIKTPVVSNTDGMVRKEDESVISEAEYNALLIEADPALHPITKTRYVIPYKSNTFEMDIYPFSEDFAVLEVELPAEDTEVTLPTFIKVVNDVTSDKRYKNKALAKTGAFPV